MPSRTIRAGVAAGDAARFPQATLLCDASCRGTSAATLRHVGLEIRVVERGQAVLGRRCSGFVETPMVHWPESMFTYVPEEPLLFSMDAFGQHYASARGFDDEVPADVLMDEAQDVLREHRVPYARPCRPAMEKVADLDVAMIAPESRRRLAAAWPESSPPIASGSVCRAKAKVLVIYDTMWESTGGWPRRSWRVPAGRGTRLRCPLRAMA